MPTGKLQTYGVMANALFDMDVGAPWLYPYIGGGVGYAWTHLGNVILSGAGRCPVRSQPSNSTKGNFAFQAIGGLSFPMPDVSRACR